MNLLHFLQFRQFKINCKISMQTKLALLYNALIILIFYRMNSELRYENVHFNHSDRQEKQPQKTQETAIKDSYQRQKR